MLINELANKQITHQRKEILDIGYHLHWWQSVYKWLHKSIPYIYIKIKDVVHRGAW